MGGQRPLRCEGVFEGMEPKEAGYQCDVCYTSYLKRAQGQHFALEHSDQLHVQK